jgi:hypothetical protein
MLIPAFNTIATEHWHFWHVVTSAVTAIGGWEGLKSGAGAVARKIIAAMPPIPANANFWETWAYRALQAVGGPNATTKPPVPPDAAPSEAKP